MSKPEWARFEEAVNRQLGLNATVASGATWKDKGDGSTRDNYEEAWPLMVDAKTTEKGSFSLKAKFLDDMKRVALQGGKTFALPLKFTQEVSQSEWVVVPLDDYAYLVERHREASFTKDEKALVLGILQSLKTPALVEPLTNILKKMGGKR